MCYTSSDCYTKDDDDLAYPEAPKRDLELEIVKCINMKNQVEYTRKKRGHCITFYNNTLQNCHSECNCMSSTVSILYS